MLSNIFQSAIGAGVGALIATWIAEYIKSIVRKSQKVEAGRDEDLKEIISVVDRMSDLSSQYWLASGAQLGEKEILIRAETVAYQQHLLKLIAHLFTGEDKRDCDVLAIRFLDAVAGGDFGDPDRDAVPQRMLGIHSYRLPLVHLVKRSRRKMPRATLS